MARQIRTGRVFLILLMCDSIIASFHALVQNEIVKKLVEIFSPGLFMNTCCNRRHLNVFLLVSCHSAGF